MAFIEAVRNTPVETQTTNGMKSVLSTDLDEMSPERIMLKAISSDRYAL